MLKIARVKTRVISVCSGVLFAAIGGFAVSPAEKANAQTAMQVYEPLGTFQAEFIAEGVNSYDGNLSVKDLIASFPLPDNVAANVFARHNAGDPASGTGAGQLRDGLPFFDVPMAEGDRIRFRDTGIRGGVANIDITVRIYKRGEDLYMAKGEEPVTMAATVTRPQFFLNPTSWTIIPTAADCMEMSQVLDSDTSMCRLPETNGECGMFYEGNRPTFEDGVDGNCRMTEAMDCTGATSIFDDGMCAASCPEERPQQTGNTCRATEAADCTGDTSFFEGGVCVAECSAGMEAGSDGIICEAATTTPPDPPDPTGPTPTLSATLDGGGGDDETKDLRNILGGVGVVMFFATWAFSDDLNNYAFSPSFGYSVNESGYSANAGGRIDFRKGDWSAYWAAGQANANGEFGDFRYASGGEYKTDFWQASFSESVQGETADYDFALSADLSGGIWGLSPVYRIHSRLEEGKTATKNTLNLEGVLEWNRWQIRQSAGFQWRRAEEFAAGGKFRLEAVREF